MLHRGGQGINTHLMQNLSNIKHFFEDDEIVILARKNQHLNFAALDEILIKSPPLDQWEAGAGILLG